MKEDDAPPAWHALDLDTVVHRLDTNRVRGLADPEASRRLAEHGPNELPEAPPPSALSLLVRQCRSVVVGVLFGAAIVSAALAEWLDAATIVAILVLNAVLGFAQEYRATRELAALKRLTVTTGRVVRDGVAREGPARDIVPGDLIEIEAGDRVPADARLVEAVALRADEAALTGESMPVDKRAATLASAAIPLADRSNLVFLGTGIVLGKGRALVVATGRRTELGRIATLMQAAGTEDTPLQRRLDRLGIVLIYVTLAFVGVVFGLGWLRGEPFFALLLTSVSLAVAAIPEGLPAIVTITLALGVTRMAARHAVVRRLPAVETLGSASIICTDKTGTLTKGEMTVRHLLAGQQEWAVSGEGYEPRGTIQPSGIAGAAEAPRSVIRDLLTAAALCSNARLTRRDGAWTVVGDPTEGALLVAAEKAGLRKDALERDQPRLGEIPFDPERKMMTVVCRGGAGAICYVKGAPDVVLPRCRAATAPDGGPAAMTDAARQHVEAATAAFGRRQLRVLGVARRMLDEVPGEYSASALERDLTFLGLAAMQDPPRPEVRGAIDACRRAGIRTLMITGDHRETALAIAAELGLTDAGGQALGGPEIDALGDEALADALRAVDVLARVSAEHKLRVVRALRRHGAIVAMTGDGVNDAPALKEADIGVAMGLTGTDVTREAADLVITDDNFATIAAAVEEGRVIYENIRRAVHYLLSCNTSEVLLMLMAALVGLPLPLLPVQILWTNLVTDGLPALALAVEPRDPSVMTRPPRGPDDRLLSPRRLAVLLRQGVLLALAPLAVFGYWIHLHGGSLDQARALTFTALVLSQLAHAFNCRSDRQSIFALGWLSNRPLVWATAGAAAVQLAILRVPWLRSVFGIGPLGGEEWLLALGLGLLPLAGMELEKAWGRMKKSSVMSLES